MTALATLQIAAEIAENNAPINEREGNHDQAQLERKVSRECRQAMSALDHLKFASILGRDNSFTDYARVGGRTALEGGLGTSLGGVAGLLAAAGLLRFPGVHRKLIQGLRNARRIPPGQKAYLDPVTPFAFNLAGLGGMAGGLAGGAHGFSSARSNMNQRNSSLWDRWTKKSSFLMPQPSLTDKARVVGRTALEGGVGGYGGGALAALLMGILGKRLPGRISPSMFGAVTGGGAVAGSLMGGRHGYTAARDNVKQRLNPLSKLRKKIGL